MSCAESYLAIIRYLTDEREPYAPGTPGNTKRKIRKAATCYVVRGGTLFYQRRLKGRDGFTELEVVLQDGRRGELITRAHVAAEGGEHRNQQLTWDGISRKYWWRGILKNVKDHIRECSSCRSRRDDGAGSRTFSRPGRRKMAAAEEEQPEEEGGEEEEEEEGDNGGGLVFTDSSSHQRTKTPKHELVFVDSQGEVNQFLPQHSQTMLAQLDQQRLQNQFCDITLLIEGEEHRAHKAVLAACSLYFNQLFYEKGAASTHEAVVDLSGFTKLSFLPLLDFAYTSRLTFNFCVMADVANLARHLLMTEVLQLCESVHRQVEEQQLTVYQRGDVHTVVSSRPAPGDAADAAAFTVTIESDGRAVVTRGGEPAAEGGEGAAPALRAAPEETLTLIPGGAEDADTVTVVTHSGQGGASESLAVVSACLEMERRAPPPGTGAIGVDTERTPEGGAVEEEAQAAEEEEAPPEASEPAPQKRKRGRPAKVKKEVELEEEEEEEEEEQPSADDEGHDPNRRRLRQRSIAEGGYARLHMGLEEEEEGRRGGGSSPRAATPKGPLRTGKRGRPPKQPVEAEGDGQSELGAEPEPGTAEGAAPPELGEGAEPEAAGAEREAGVDGEHTCSECGASFQRRYALIMHTLKHEKARGYKCSLCSKEFQYAASLRAHLARHKQSGQRATPPKPPGAEPRDELSERTPASSPLTRREFVCDICGKTLPKLYSLRIHMLTHTGVRPHACRLCNKSFAHKHSLKTHRALHDRDRRHTCSYCGKSFVSKRSMEEHRSLHTGESKYLCNTCGATFHRASALSKHLKKHLPRPAVRPFCCAHCDKRFFEAKDLQQHMNKHLGLKPFQCQVCGKCYSWKKDWYSHVKSHSVAEPYRCTVCGKEFFEKALFRRHVKKATHGKKGRVKQNLERECETCGRKFTQLREYRRHVNNHQGVKPFECLTCGVAWADARSLKRHVRTHTGERPYVCPLCQEAHIDARTLRKHMARYHGDNLPGKIMLEKDTLQFHNQGTQVEHAVSILASELPPELRPAPPEEQELEEVLITEETVEAVEAGEGGGAGEEVGEEAGRAAGDGSLSDQGIMQVVNYVLAQQSLDAKMEDGAEGVQTVEVEVEHLAQVE